MTHDHDQKPPTWDDETKYDNPVASVFHPPEVVAHTLLELHHKLLSAPKLKKGAEWRGYWAGWDSGQNWFPEKQGVYVLWACTEDFESGVVPVYVGEGYLGPRIGESFVSRPTWNFAQMLVDDQISGNTREHQWWRKTLERFVILALQPADNRD